MKSLRDQYRGFLWPYLGFIGGVGFGAASEAHSAWHYTEWPSLAVALIAVTIGQSKIKRGQP